MSCDKEKERTQMVRVRVRARVRARVRLRVRVRVRVWVWVWVELSGAATGKRAGVRVASAKTCAAPSPISPVHSSRRG